MKHFLLITLLLLTTSTTWAQSFSSFSIQPFDENQFTTFVHVFSDMRGPLRSEF